VERAEKSVRIIEAFWIDIAILPCESESSAIALSRRREKPPWFIRSRWDEEERQTFLILTRTTSVRRIRGFPPVRRGPIPLPLGTHGRTVDESRPTAAGPAPVQLAEIHG
jgi:hypothetical protein